MDTTSPPHTGFFASTLQKTKFNISKLGKKQFYKDTLNRNLNYNSVNSLNLTLSNESTLLNNSTSLSASNLNNMNNKSYLKRTNSSKEVNLNKNIFIVTSSRI
jgi:hypothetical protein